MQTTIEAGPHFLPGEKVEVHPRVTDHPTGAWGDPVKTETIPNDGTLKLTGLVPFADYWLRGETGRTVAFEAATDADPASYAEEVRLKGEANTEMRSKAKLHTAKHSPTVVDEPEGWGPAAHNFEKSSEPEPTPRAKQADMSKSTPQRSSTPLGEATPADPDEWQPRVPQSAVKKGTPQRSDTPEGEATPVDPNESEPGLRQEDAKGKQRSDTPLGTAAPVPKTRSKAKIEEAKDSSVSKAKGATVPVAGTDKVKGKTNAKADKPVAKKPPRKSPA